MNDRYKGNLNDIRFRMLYRIDKDIKFDTFVGVYRDAMCAVAVRTDLCRGILHDRWKYGKLENER